MGTYATPAAVVVISLLFPILGTIAVSLRFYTRTKAKIGIRIDDWLILPALVRTPFQALLSLRLIFFLVP